MAKKRVYIETSVFGWLTAKPCNDILKTAKQRQTVIWWERRSEWDCFLTTTVLDEIALGDTEAIERRKEKAHTLPELPITAEVKTLADLLLAKRLVPEDALPDAYHLAAAAFHRATYLLTWNQSHLDNLQLRSRIEECIKEYGLTPAKVITPERLMEEK